MDTDRIRKSIEKLSSCSRADFDIHVVPALRRGIDGVLEESPDPSASGRGVVIARRTDVLQDVARGLFEDLVLHRGTDIVTQHGRASLAWTPDDRPEEKLYPPCLVTASQSVAPDALIRAGVEGYETTKPGGSLTFGFRRIISMAISNASVADMMNRDAYCTMRRPPTG